MKRFTLYLFGAALCLAAACSPETFTMNIEMRYPSACGLDFSRKTLSVVYQDEGTGPDSTFLRSIATGFARKMEEDYYAGAEAIKLFEVPVDTASEVRKAYLQDLIMDTGDDVVFYFTRPEFGAVGTGVNQTSTVLGSRDSAYLCPVVIPFKLRVYTYDSMNKEDNILYFNGSTSIRPKVYNDGSLTSDQLVSLAWQNAEPLAENVGARATDNFVSTWKAERYSFYYYSGGTWDKASQAAYEYRWADAIKLWTEIVESARPLTMRRACAEYNLANTFYILGNFDLATRWLDLADADASLPLSSGLRTRINSRKK